MIYTHKKILIITLIIISVFSLQTVDAARRYRTYDTQYQAQDSGRYGMNNQLYAQINALSSQPIQANVRIPLLFGVKIGDLEDTWGDARSDGRTHEGIDIMAPRGTLVVSPTDAIVTTVENSGNGGNHVFTANPGGERFYYAHLDSFAKNLTQGQILKAGDLIGYVGNSGNASAGPTHLHFGIYHDDHVALNPFPRLTAEFSLQERIDSITKILNASDDQMTLARTLVAQYRSVFTQAQTSGISLPTAISQVLLEKIAQVQTITRTLKIGMKGDDVKALQESLGILPSDGAFGPKTKAGVVAFQASHGLVSDGVFGPLSRQVLGGGAVSYPQGCTSSTAYSTVTGIKCTPVIR